MSKFFSRKFITALIGVVVGIAIAFGIDSSDISTIAGAVTVIISVVSYIHKEGVIDQTRIESLAGAFTTIAGEVMTDDETEKAPEEET